MSNPLLPVLVVLTAASVVEAQGSRFRDDRLGIELRVPSGWRPVPLLPDGRGTLLRYCSDRVYVTRDRDYNYEHRPVLTVVCFTPDRQEAGDDERAPFVDYADYLARTRGKRGFTIRSSTAEAGGGASPVRFTVDVHDRVRPKRLVTDVFRIPGLAVAVEFEMLSDRVDRVLPVAEKCLQSFGFLEQRDLRAAAALWEPLVDPAWVVDRDAWRALSVSERHARRSQVEAARRASLELLTPRALDRSESAHLLVFSTVDKAYTRRATGAVEAMWSWCETELDELSDELVRGGYLALAEADDPLPAGASPSSLTRGFELDEPRVLTFERDTYNGNTGLGMGSLFRGVLAMHLQDKEPLAFRYMPRWINAGLFGYVHDVRVKRRKLEFELDEYDREDVRQLVRADKLLDLRRIVSLDDATYSEMLKADARTADQVVLAVAFLFGPARKHRPARGFVVDYLKAVAEIADRQRKTWNDEEDLAAIVAEEEKAKAELVDENGEKPAAAPSAKEPKDPKAEKRRLKRELWQRRRAAISRELPATIGLSDKDWGVLERAFRKFAEDV